MPSIGIVNSVSFFRLRYSRRDICVHKYNHISHALLFTGVKTETLGGKKFSNNKLSPRKTNSRHTREECTFLWFSNSVGNRLPPVVSLDGTFKRDSFSKRIVERNSIPS